MASVIIASGMVCDDADGFKQLLEPRRFDTLEEAYAFVRGDVGREYSDGRAGRQLESVDDRLEGAGELMAEFSGGFILYRVDELR